MEYEGTIARENEHTCAHFWILARDNFGVCNKCGARKYFPATWTSYSRSKKKIDLVPHKTVLGPTIETNK
jgi:hypothetical protein